MAIEDTLSAAGIPYPVAAEILNGLKSGGSTSSDRLINLGVPAPAAEELARQVNTRTTSAHLLTNSGFPPMASSAIRTAIQGGASSKPVYQSANSRFIMPFGRQQATAEAVRFGYNLTTMISPPWDCIAPRLGFAAWWGTSTAAGAVGDCEVTLGNDWPIEAAIIEILGVKYNLTKNGQRAFTVPDGGHIWTDADLDSIKIPANTIFRVGSADALALNQYRPSIQAIPMPLSVIQTADGRGDANSTGTTSRLSTMDNNVTGGAPTPSGNFAGSALMLIAKPDPADPRSANAKSVMILGDSRAWGDAANTMPYGIGTGALSGTRAAIGAIACSMNSDDGGRLPYISLAVPGTRLRDLLVEGSTITGERGFKRRKAMLDEVGLPFTSILLQHGINTVSNYNATETVAQADQVLTAVKSYFPGKKVVGATLPPHSFSSNLSDNAANGYRWTSGLAADQVRQSAAPHDAYNAWVIANLPYADPAKLMRIDDNNPGLWRKPAYNQGGALAAAAAIGDTSIQLNYKPEPGDSLVLAPGASTTAYEQVIISTVSGSATPYTANLKSALTKAQASGTQALGRLAADGLHQTSQGVREELPAWITAKSLYA